MKYLLIFLVVLVIFIISVTLGAHNDQVITFNYLLAQGEFRISTLLATLFVFCWDGLFADSSGYVFGSLWPMHNVKLSACRHRLIRARQRLSVNRYRRPRRNKSPC